MIYSLDANVLINPWNGYYSPEICPSYWDLISSLARDGVVFVTNEVRKEIEKKDDGLKAWLNDNSHIIRDTTTEVQMRLRELYAANPAHVNLVQNDGQHSVADPWVIAHAWALNATVVTKETPSASPNIRKIKIPDVCNNLNIRYIDDYVFFRELGIQFECKRM